MLVPNDQMQESLDLQSNLLQRVTSLEDQMSSAVSLLNEINNAMSPFTIATELITALGILIGAVAVVIALVQYFRSQHTNWWQEFVQIGNLLFSDNPSQRETGWVLLELNISTIPVLGSGDELVAPRVENFTAARTAVASLLHQKKLQQELETDAILKEIDKVGLQRNIDALKKISEINKPLKWWQWDEKKNLKNERKSSYQEREKILERKMDMLNEEIEKHTPLSEGQDRIDQSMNKEKLDSVKKDLQ